MKKILLVVLFAGCAAGLYAQPNGIGQSGAMQLLFNTWARSSGFMGVDVASVTGIEGSGVNPAGLGAATGTELMFAQTRWLMGSGVSINTFGFSQSLGGGSSVLGLTVQSFDVGDFTRTTVNQPDGTLGTFRPAVTNISANYARQFTDHIYVGTTVRIISESTPEVSAGGLALDAGIQYRTGRKDRLKLGISLRNVGPTMRYSGDGMSVRALLNARNNFDSGLEIPTSDYELPVVLSMGGSYDFLMGTSNTVSLLASYMSHSAFYNQTGLGLQYKYKEFFMVRGAFLYDEGMLNGDAVRYDAHTGLAAGVTFQAPFKAGRKNKFGEEDFSLFGFDVSYRTSNPFGGTLTFGARIDL